MSKHLIRLNKPKELLLLGRIRKHIMEHLRVCAAVLGNHKTKCRHLRTDLVYRNTHHRPDVIVWIFFSEHFAEHDVVVVLSSLLRFLIIVVIVERCHLERFWWQIRAVRVVKKRGEALVVF